MESKMADLIRELGATGDSGWELMTLGYCFWSSLIEEDKAEEEEDRQVRPIVIWKSLLKVGVGEPEDNYFPIPSRNHILDSLYYRLGYVCATYIAYLWMNNHHTANAPSTMTQVSSPFVQMLLIFNGSWPLVKRLNPSLWSNLHSNAADLPCTKVSPYFAKDHINIQ